MSLSCNPPSWEDTAALSPPRCRRVACVEAATHLVAQAPCLADTCRVCGPSGVAGFRICVLTTQLWLFSSVGPDVHSTTSVWESCRCAMSSLTLRILDVLNVCEFDGYKMIFQLFWWIANEVEHLLSVVYWPFVSISVKSFSCLLPQYFLLDWLSFLTMYFCICSLWALIFYHYPLSVMIVLPGVARRFTFILVSVFWFFLMNRSS